MNARLPIVILISGNGSNLQAIINASLSNLPVEIRAVFSNKPNALGLERAKKAKIPAVCLDHTQFTSREAFDLNLVKRIMPYKPELIVLAGFMRRLTAHFTHQFEKKIINIHPSLLPKYPGLNTHAKVLAAKDQYHGVSIHLVNEKLDSGPVITQAKLEIGPTETETNLKKRIQSLEHDLYPKTLQWIAERRIVLHGKTIVFDGAPLPATGLLLKNVGLK